jgi:hypothetical protein
LCFGRDRRGSANSRRFYCPMPGISWASQLHHIVRISLSLATTLLGFGDLPPSGSRLNIDDSFKSTSPIENKRHTNAHQPLASCSAIGVTKPSSPPLAKHSMFMCARRCHRPMARRLAGSGAIAGEGIKSRSPETPLPRWGQESYRVLSHTFPNCCTFSFKFWPFDA